jgi:hypothetical protein
MRSHALVSPMGVVRPSRNRMNGTTLGPARAAAPPTLSVAAPTDARSKRISALDVTRGWLMIAILVGHAAANLDQSLLSRTTLKGLLPIFRLGTIGFACVSGLLLGSFIATHPDLPRIFARYRQQGLRLLFVVHPILALALWGPMGNGTSLSEFMLGRWYITDTLALLFVGLVPLLPRLSPTCRLVVGVALMALARPLSYQLGLESRGLQLMQDMLFGTETRGSHVLLDTYGITQIAGIFMIGSYVGHHFGLSNQRGELGQLARRLRRAVVPLTLASVVLGGAWVALKWGPLSSGHPFLRFVLYPDRFLSLFPVYMAVVIALIAAICIRSQTRAPGHMDRVCLILGKTSLFTYVVQYLLVQTLPYYLGLRGSMSLIMCGVWTLGACAVAFGAASVWNAWFNGAERTPVRSPSWGVVAATK